MIEHCIKTWLTLVALLLIGHALPARADTTLPAEPAPERPTLSIVAWNIQWYPGKWRVPDEGAIPAHVAVVHPELRSINPDILLAQEIRDWQAFAELSDVVPGLRPVTVSAFRAEDTGEYWPQQIAIGSKLPAVAAWSEFWREGEIHPRRGFSAAAIQLPQSDDLLLVYSVHLKSNRAEDEDDERLNFATRDESIRQLLNHVHDMETVVFPGRIAGVVVGGDFNTNQDGRFGDRVHDLMVAGGFYNTWGDTPPEQRPTWRGNHRFPPATFDHIYVKGLGTPRAELLDPPEDTSDHRPVKLRIPVP